MLNDAEISPDALATLGSFFGGDGAPEGRLPLVALQGLLAAVVSSPDVCLPSAWLPRALGTSDEAAFDDADQLRTILPLLMDWHNAIARSLQEETIDDFTIGIAGDDGKLSVGAAVVWAMGYVSGVSLQIDRWMPAFEDGEADALFTLAQAGSHGGADLDDPELREAAAALPDVVWRLHQFWYEQRLRPAPQRPVRRATPKVGRNEACPCGSGRKFKKCCGRV